MDHNPLPLLIRGKLADDTLPHDSPRIVWAPRLDDSARTSTPTASTGEVIGSSPRRLLGPGDPAPSFTLPAVNGPGAVSLSDYLGRAPLLLGLFRGLHCPFCRRRLAQLTTTQEK